MTEMSFEVRLDGLKARIEPMERLVTALANSVPKPLHYHSGKEHYGFRYAKPDVLHFCLLKAVRAVSALNAMVSLARGGYAQEIGVLVRTLVECTTMVCCDPKSKNTSENTSRTMPGIARVTSSALRYNNGSFTSISAKR